MNQLTLPSIKGKIGNWVYFIATMKLSDVANKSRISTVTELDELYPKTINEVLQRDLDTKRINKISEYLQKQQERFLSSLIVAIYKGNPSWSEIRIEDSFQIDKEKVASETLQYARGRLGFLILNGDESLFVLDGQHRLRGIREAYTKNPQLVGSDDIILTFIVHETTFKEKTRRLFTVLNRYAEKPKKAELIIMEEDDAAAILTRRLILTHPFFINPNSISKSKGTAMPGSDNKSFTTLVCLYDITKELIGYNSLYPKSSMIKRLDNEILDKLYNENILPFWKYFLDNFPYIQDFVKGTLDDKKIIRNKENGGSLLLRPEGQLLISSLYKFFQSKGESEFQRFQVKLPAVDFNLSHPLWKYLFWTGDKMNPKNKALKKNVLLFLLGEKISVGELKSDYDALYKEYNDEFKTELTPI